MSLAQTLTSVQEQTLTAVPRLVVVFVVTMTILPWMVHRLVSFTLHMLTGLSQVPGIERMNREASMLIEDWPQYLTAAVLVMVRLSGLMVFAPLFSSAAIAPRIKAGFVIAMTVLLAPAVAAVPNARVSLDMRAVLGELGVGLVFGLVADVVE